MTKRGTVPKGLRFLAQFWGFLSYLTAFATVVKDLVPDEPQLRDGGMTTYSLFFARTCPSWIENERTLRGGEERYCRYLVDQSSLFGQGST